MLNEPVSALDDRRPRSSGEEIIETEKGDAPYSAIRSAVESVLSVESERFPPSDNGGFHDDAFLMLRDSRLLVTYNGNLLIGSEEAYNKLDELLLPHNLFPIFRQGEADKSANIGVHVVHVMQNRVEPKSGGNRLSMVLFLLTVCSVMFVGTISAINEIYYDDPMRANAMASSLGSFIRELWRGLPYAVSILLILGAHELGHYFMSRRHRLAASLPYFLPLPLPPFGTLGAAIRLREPMRDRKSLLDIGVAGPFAGMIFAIPILLIGLSTSPIIPISSGMAEGNSILYALSKIVVFGRFLPDGEVDVYVNQLAWAGWTGLLITGLNLIPVGQLDGGHVLYALLGRYAKMLYYPIVGAMLLLTILISNELMIFVLLIILLGNHHAMPLDDITPLDKRRQIVAIMSMVLFVLVFVPSPLTQVTADITNPHENLPDGQNVMLPVIVFASLWLARRRLFLFTQRQYRQK